MDAKFWHDKWENNQIGFHQPRVNPALVTHIHALPLAAGDRIFLPLCGKTLDIGWLLEQGYQVVGAELSVLAIQQLFAQLGVEPEITDLGDVKLYSATNIDIFVGDIFEVTRDMLGPVDAVYDRAALVALPPEMRVTYAQHLTKITKTVPQLILTFEYDQDQMSGPPFSVVQSEVERHYQDSYDVTLLNTKTFLTRGTLPMQRHVFLLERRA
jgi:thiopurine S-methyltransferase